MSKMKNMLALSLAVIVSAVTVELFAEPSGGDSDFAIKKSEAQTVLYTVYRGPYEGIGSPVGELYGLAMQKNIKPSGPIALVYLNNPQNTSREHYLVEIRIPVDSNALQQAGSLGLMTDVKILKATEYAVMKKPLGQTDYEAFYSVLYWRIAKEGYHRTDNAIEVLTDVGMGGDYRQMKTKTMVPVAKNPPVRN
jgi:effector-binding domain-containing protein